ncbi:MAG: TetR/AcrR family transcriptional regulator, partial [Anaerolineales bacterium]
MDNKKRDMPKGQSRMRGAERRALILAQAKKIFAQKGYRGASTGELARASGITEPILYKHFGSKKKLYLTVLAMLSEQFIESFRGLVERRAETNLLDSLTNLLIDYRNAAMKEHDNIHLLLNAALESNDPEVIQLTQEHNREMYALV